MNAFYFKFYLQQVGTQNIPPKKNVLNPRWSINYRSTLWMRYKTKPRDIWSMANIFCSWYLYKKHFPTTNLTSLWIIAGQHDSLSPPCLMISSRTSKIIQPWPNDFSLALVKRSPCSWNIKFYIKPLFSGF